MSLDEHRQFGKDLIKEFSTVDPEMVDNFRQVIVELGTSLGLREIDPLADFMMDTLLLNIADWDQLVETEQAFWTGLYTLAITLLTAPAVMAALQDNINYSMSLMAQLQLPPLRNDLAAATDPHRDDYLEDEVRPARNDATAESLDGGEPSDPGDD